MKNKKLVRKIAIITPTLLIKGGTQNQLVNFALECKKDGDICEIFTFAYFPTETYNAFDQVKVNSVILLTSGSFLVRILRYLKIDLQSFFLYFSFFFESKFLNLLSNKKFDVLNPHDWFGTWIAVDAKRKFSLDSSIITMLNDVPSFFSSKHGIKSYLSKIIDANKQSDVDSIMVLDNKMRSKVLQYYGSGHKIELVRSGIEIDRYKNLQFPKQHIRQSLGVAYSDFLFTCASVPSPHRRFEDVILSLKDISPTAKLLIIGDFKLSKKYGDSLKRLVYKLQLENRVHFISKFLPSEQRAGYIASSDTYIFPNENQTWGLGVIEAMSLGVPCIVSNGAGVHEVLTSEDNALIYNVSKTAELTLCMKQIMNQKILRNKLISNGKCFVVDNYSWSKYKDSVYSIFFLKK